MVDKSWVDKSNGYEPIAANFVEARRRLIGGEISFEFSAGSLFVAGWDDWTSFRLAGRCV